jgi:hypothetical protein
MYKLVAIVPVLFFTLSTCSQEVPKGVNRIIISNTKSAAENFTDIQNILIDNGYAIARKDDEFHTVRTEPVTPKKTASSNFYNFVARDSSIILSGFYKPLVMLTIGYTRPDANTSMIENKGMKGSIVKDAFVAMDKMAHLIQGTISYEKK